VPQEKKRKISGLFHCLPLPLWLPLPKLELISVNISKKRKIAKDNKKWRMLVILLPELKLEVTQSFKMIAQYSFS
jgi:hypothetical protein